METLGNCGLADLWWHCLHEIQCCAAGTGKKKSVLPSCRDFSCAFSFPLNTLPWQDLEQYSSSGRSEHKQRSVKDLTSFILKLSVKNHILWAKLCDSLNKYQPSQYMRLFFLLQIWVFYRSLKKIFQLFFKKNHKIAMREVQVLE